MLKGDRYFGMKNRELRKATSQFWASNKKSIRLKRGDYSQFNHIVG